MEKGLTVQNYERHLTELRKNTSISAKQAFEGVNIRTGLKLNPGATFDTLLAELTKTILSIDASKTISDPEELTEVVDVLIEEFPTMTIEGFLMAFKNMRLGKYGKYFERFKIPEIREGCLEYCNQQAEILERKHQESKNTMNTIEVDYAKWIENNKPENKEERKKRIRKMREANERRQQELKKIYGKDENTSGM